MRHLFKRPSPAMVVACISLFVALSGATYAATGGNFILGQANTATSPTGLTSNNAGKALNLTQQSTGTGATALGLNVPAGKTPFTVNSGTKVANLNADRIDGLDSSAFVRTTGKAADANLLDGIDSSGFTQGAGQNVRGAAALQPFGGGWYAILITTNPSLTIGYNCPANVGANGILVLRNDSSETVNVFSDNGGSNPEYRQLAPNGDRWDQGAAAGGEQITFAVQGSAQALIQVNSVHRATDCHIQAQGILTR